jgi:two-component system, NarL family, sensor histidine kinase UhpB
VALTVVCLEDDPLDAELVREELRGVLSDMSFRHVMTESDYRQEVQHGNPDLILADYNLPGFDGLSALAIARETRPLTPFIFVSGALGEEIAIETLKSGATDYVLKSRLKRLGPAVLRALSEATERFERRRAERELESQRNLLEALINTIPDAIYAVDRDERLLLANQALLENLGRTAHQVLGKRLRDLGDLARVPDRRGSEDSYLMSSGSAIANREQLVRTRSGDVRWHSTTKALLRAPDNGDVTGLVSVSRDVTSTHVLEEELSEISNREQRRIGSDLHDGLGQELTGLSLMLKGIETAIEREAPQFRSQVVRIRQVLTQAIESTRALARGLSPVNLERGGLPAALEHLARQFQAMYGLSCEYHSALRPDVSVDETSATHLYRIAQEAMANAAKHSGARTLSVSLSSPGDGLLLQIADDGRGISAAMQAEPPGMGLKLMEYRARMIGGELAIAPGEKTGTVVSCLIPLSPTGRFVRPRPKAAAARR